MAAYELLLLNTAIPQIQAAQSGDTYVVPRDIAFSAALTLSAGTANGVPYLNASKVLTTGSALSFDGTDFSNTVGKVISASDLRASTSGSGNIGLNLVRSGGTAADWYNYIPAGTNDLAWFRGSELMRLTSTGLGIGTSSPGEKLQVVGKILATGDARIGVKKAGSDSIGAGPFFSLQNADASREWFNQLGASNTLDWWHYNGSSYTKYATLDSSGNLGLGVTPSAWSSTWKAFQISNRSLAQTGAGAGDLTMVFNGYFDSTDSRWEFQNAGDYAARYSITGAGVHSWHISTAAGANANDPITFTQAMTLDASGNLAIGTTSFSAGARLIVDGGNIVHGGSQFNFNPGASTQYELVNRNGAGFDFYVNSAATLAARITSGGDLLVKKTSSGGTATGIDLNANGFVGSYSPDTSDSTVTYAAYSNGASAYRFYVGWGGTVFATNTTISAISDQRFKENIRDLDIGLNAILALKPRKFDWKIGKGKDKKDDRGFIAQEFEQVFPDLIDTWKDPAPEGEKPYKSVRQDLIPVLVKAIQEQQAMINELKAEVAALKGA